MQDNRQNYGNINGQYQPYGNGQPTMQQNGQYQPYGNGQPTMQQNGQYQPYGNGQPTMQQNGQYQPYGNGQPTMQQNGQYQPYGNGQPMMGQPQVMPKNSQFPPYANGQQMGNGQYQDFTAEQLRRSSLDPNDPVLKMTRARNRQQNPDLRTKSLIPAIAGVLIAVFTCSNFPKLALFIACLSLMITFILAQKDVRPFKKESKFSRAMYAAASGVGALGAFISMVMPGAGKLAAGAALLLGIIVAVTPHVARSLKKKRCTERTKAVCIGNDSHMSGSGRNRKMVFAPIWQYTLGGRAYTHGETVYKSPQEFQNGEGTELLVNPNDPMDFLRESDHTNLIPTVIGAVIALISIITMLK